MRSRGLGGGQPRAGWPGTDSPGSRRDSGDERPAAPSTCPPEPSPPASRCPRKTNIYSHRARLSEPTSSPRTQAGYSKPRAGPAVRCLSLPTCMASSASFSCCLSGRSAEWLRSSWRGESEAMGPYSGVLASALAPTGTGCVHRVWPSGTKTHPRAQALVQLLSCSRQTPSSPQATRGCEGGVSPNLVEDRTLSRARQGAELTGDQVTH